MCEVRTCVRAVTSSARAKVCGEADVEDAISCSLVVARGTNNTRDCCFCVSGTW
jgi:hypothetical protein